MCSNRIQNGYQVAADSCAKHMVSQIAVFSLNESLQELVFDHEEAFPIPSAYAIPQASGHRQTEEGPPGQPHISTE